MSPKTTIGNNIDDKLGAASKSCGSLSARQATRGWGSATNNNNASKTTNKQRALDPRKKQLRGSSSASTPTPTPSTTTSSSSSAFTRIPDASGTATSATTRTTTTTYNNSNKYSNSEKKKPLTSALKKTTIYSSSEPASKQRQKQARIGDLDSSSEEEEEDNDTKLHSKLPMIGNTTTVPKKKNPPFSLSSKSAHAATTTSASSIPVPEPPQGMLRSQSGGPTGSSVSRLSSTSSRRGTSPVPDAAPPIPGILNKSEKNPTQSLYLPRRQQQQQQQQQQQHDPSSSNSNSTGSTFAMEDDSHSNSNSHSANDNANASHELVSAEDLGYEDTTKKDDPLEDLADLGYHQDQNDNMNAAVFRSLQEKQVQRRYSAGGATGLGARRRRYSAGGGAQLQQRSPPRRRLSNGLKLDEQLSLLASKSTTAAAKASSHTRDCRSLGSGSGSYESGGSGESGHSMDKQLMRMQKRARRRRRGSISKEGNNTKKDSKQQRRSHSIEGDLRASSQHAETNQQRRGSLSNRPRRRGSSGVDENTKQTNFDMPPFRRYGSSVGEYQTVGNTKRNSIATSNSQRRQSGSHRSQSMRKSRSKSPFHEDHSLNDSSSKSSSRRRSHKSKEDQQRRAPPTPKLLSDRGGSVPRQKRYSPKTPQARDRSESAQRRKKSITTSSHVKDDLVVPKTPKHAKRERSESVKQRRKDVPATPKLTWDRKVPVQRTQSEHWQPTRTKEHGKPSPSPNSLQTPRKRGKSRALDTGKKSTGGGRRRTSASVETPKGRKHQLLDVSDSETVLVKSSRRHELQRNHSTSQLTEHENIGIQSKPPKKGQPKLNMGDHSLDSACTDSLDNSEDDVRLSQSCHVDKGADSRRRLSSHTFLQHQYHYDEEKEKSEALMKLKNPVKSSSKRLPGGNLLPASSSQRRRQARRGSGGVVDAESVISSYSRSDDEDDCSEGDAEDDDSSSDEDSLGWSAKTWHAGIAVAPDPMMVHLTAPSRSPVQRSKSGSMLLSPSGPAKRLGYGIGVDPLASPARMHQDFDSLVEPGDEIFPVLTNRKESLSGLLPQSVVDNKPALGVGNESGNGSNGSDESDDDADIDRLLTGQKAQRAPSSFDFAQDQPMQQAPSRKEIIRSFSLRGFDDDDDEDEAAAINAHQRSSEHRNLVRTFSLRDSLDTGRSPFGRENKIVRTFSLRSSVGSLLGADLQKDETNINDEAEDQDDIISYGSGEWDCSDSDPGSEEDGDEDEDEEKDKSNNDIEDFWAERADDKNSLQPKQEDREQQNADQDDKPSCKGDTFAAHAHLTASNEKVKTKSKRKNSARKSRGKMVAKGALGDLISSVSGQSNPFENGNDSWAEFENGSILDDSDSDDDENLSDDDEISVDNARVINWNGESLDPAATPLLSPFRTKKGKANSEFEELLAQVPTVSPNRKSKSKGKKARDSSLKRSSLLVGGVARDFVDDWQDSIIASSVTSSIGGSSVESSLGSYSDSSSRTDKSKRSSRKGKKPKNFPKVNEADKFDWALKAKADRLREAEIEKKSKKDLTDDSTSDEGKPNKMEVGKPKRRGSTGGSDTVDAKSSKTKGMPRRTKSSDGAPLGEGKTLRKGRRRKSVEGPRTTDELAGAKSKSEHTPKCLKQESKRKLVGSNSLIAKSEHLPKTTKSSSSKSQSDDGSESKGKDSHLSSGDKLKSARRKKFSDNNGASPPPPPELHRFSTAGDADSIGSSSKNENKLKGSNSESRPKDQKEKSRSKSRTTQQTSSSSVRRKSVDSKKDRDKSNGKYEEKIDPGLLEELYKKLLEDPISACSMLDEYPLLAKAKDTNGCLPLHIAASQPSIPLEVLEKIIQAFPGACEVQSEKGYTPLHFAVEAGIPTPNVKVLIKGSPRALKLKDSKGQIPLHVAAYNNASVTSIRLLIFIYPDSIDVENARGETARKVAKKKKAHAEVLSELKGGSSKQV